MSVAALKTALSAQLPSLRWNAEVPMSRYTTLRAGGPADLLAEPADTAELKTLIALAERFDVLVTVIGNGSNLLVRDGGIRGLVVRLGRPFSAVSVDGCEIRARSGLLLSDLAQRALEFGLTGLEFASGIPGSLGGAVCMNAGAYGGEIAQVIESAEVLSGGEVRTLERPALELGYRKSRMQRTGEIVLSATLKLEPGDPAEIRERMADLQARRKDKQPLNYPSAGSFFKRPEGAYAAQLIDEAGLKGLSVNGARVSEKHAGFLVNTGGATADDFLRLMRAVQDAVERHSGYRLEPEVRILGEDGDAGILG